MYEATLSVRRHGSGRKSQIVEAMLRLAAEHGTDAVTAQLIADAVGFTQGAVFRHFRSMEEAWLAVMDWLQERLSEIRAAAGGEAGPLPPLARLERVFRGHIDLIERYPALAKVALSDHLRRHFPSLSGRFHVLHQQYGLDVMTLIEEARREGAVSPNLNLEAAATLFFAMIQGLAFQAVVAREQRNLRRAADQAFPLFLRGLGADGPSRSRQATPRG